MDNRQPMERAPRRHDIDWLRTLALGLLVVYHIVLSFQAWAPAIGFPVNNDLLEGLWPVMAALNIWRIPLLFLVSGMGVRFAMERRDWKALIRDRTLRLMVPYVFGIVVLNLLLAGLLPRLGWRADYTLHFGHLWFLLNIYCYALWFLGLWIYFKENPGNPVFGFLRRIMAWRLGLLLLAVPVVLEAQLVNPQYFSSYVDTLHGWLIGFVCFFLGWLFAALPEAFWPAVVRLRWIALALAVAGYLVRWLVYSLEGLPNGLIGFEAMNWIFAVLGFGALHLNRRSRVLAYLSEAVYPVYIVHLPVQFAIAYFLLPTGLAAGLKLLLLTAGTFGFSLALYELLLKRVVWLRPLFGMKWQQVPRRAKPGRQES